MGVGPGTELRALFLCRFTSESSPPGAVVGHRSNNDSFFCPKLGSREVGVEKEDRGMSSVDLNPPGRVFLNLQSEPQRYC